MGYPSDVRQVYLGADGLLAGLKAGSIAVDMTTSQPSLAQEIHKQAHAFGIHSIDAPVSGGDVGARNGTLSVMVGAENAESLNTIQPLLQRMSKTVTHLGGV